MMVGQEEVTFKTGKFSLTPLSQETRQSTVNQYLFYQADHALTAEEKASLEASGIQILYALHQNLYWVRVTKDQQSPVAKNLFEIDPDFKIGTDISDRSQSNSYRLSIAPGMGLEEINSWADQHKITVLDTRAASFGFIDAEVPGQTIQQVINTPWIAFIGAVPKDEEIQYRASQGERGWGLTSPLTRGLNGTGMTVGIGDGGRLGLHDDLKRSIIDLSSFNLSNHATQVSGII